MPVTLAEPSNELCIEWQPSHSATPPEWNARAFRATADRKTQSRALPSLFEHFTHG